MVRDKLLCLFQVGRSALLWELARYHFSVSPALPWVMALQNQRDRWPPSQKKVKSIHWLGVGMSCNWGVDSRDVAEEEAIWKLQRKKSSWWVILRHFPKSTRK